MNRTPSPLRTPRLVVSLVCGAIIIAAAFAVHADAAPPAVFGATTHVAISAPKATTTPRPTTTPNPTTSPTAAPNPTTSPTAAPNPTTSPTAAPSPADCYALRFGSQWYCTTAISKVQATALGTGKRVVLRDVSVINTTTSTVTVAGLEWTLCPPGNYCGASATVKTLIVTWTGTARPTSGQVINLFGVTVTGSLSPVGYVVTDACHIDWC